MCFFVVQNSADMSDHVLLVLVLHNVLRKPFHALSNYILRVSYINFTGTHLTGARKDVCR